MKKEYSAPLVKYLAFSIEETIAAEPNWSGGNTDTSSPEGDANSMPWNDGNLGGWT